MTFHGVDNFLATFFRKSKVNLLEGGCLLFSPFGENVRLLISITQYAYLQSVCEGLRSSCIGHVDVSNIVYVDDRFDRISGSWLGRVGQNANQIWRTPCGAPFLFAKFDATNHCLPGAVTRVVSRGYPG